jgi:hypothetical protein
MVITDPSKLLSFYKKKIIPVPLLPLPVTLNGYFPELLVPDAIYLKPIDG